MTLVKYTPNRSVIPFASAINQVFDDFIPGFFGRTDTPTVNFRPSVDIVEQEHQIIVKADMPGLEKGNIKVTVDDGLLTIEGTRNETRKETDKGYVRNERFVGTFSLEDCRRLQERRPRGHHPEDRSGEAQRDRHQGQLGALISQTTAPSRQHGAGPCHIGRKRVILD